MLARNTTHDSNPSSSSRIVVRDYKVLEKRISTVTSFCIRNSSATLSITSHYFEVRALVGGPCFSSSDVFLFCWAAFFSISLLASVFPVSLPLFFLFFRPCLIHARLPEWGRAFVHGHTFLHSRSGPMTVVIGLLHGATFLSNLTLVLFVSFIRP